MGQLIYQKDGNIAYSSDNIKVSGSNIEKIRGGKIEEWQEELKWRRKKGKLPKHVVEYLERKKE